MPGREIDNIATLRARLAETEAALAALRDGSADALVTAGRVIGLVGAEKPYQTFFSAMNEGGLTLNADGYILHCNPRLSAMLGRDLATIRGCRFVDYITPEDGALFNELLSRDDAGSCETTLVRQDHAALPVRLSSRPMYLDAHRLFCLVVTDLTERLQAEAIIRQKEAKMRGIFLAAPIGIGLVVHGLLTEVNQKLCDMTGFSADELLGKSSRLLYPSDEIFEYVNRENYNKIATHGVGTIETRFRHKNGSAFHVLLSSALIIPGNRAAGLAFTALDISDQKQAEEILHRAAVVFNNSQEGILICDSQNHILDVNPSFCRITGYRREEVLGRNPSIMQSGLHDTNFYQWMWQSLTQHNAWRGEIWDRRKNGEIYAELLSIDVSRDEKTGAPVNYVGVFSDITRIKEYEKEIDRIAHYDPLTGTPNRRLLADRLENSLGRARRSAKFVAVSYLDLDGFKDINDRYGHEQGDRLLLEITQRLSGSMRSGDTLSRLSGDDFVILLNDLGQDQECVQILDRVLTTVSAPVLVNGMTHSLTASIGVTIFPCDDTDVDTLLRHANQAMIRAKETGKNRFHLYDPEYDRQIKAQRDALQRLTEALEREELVLYYQPKVNMLTREVVGAEALIRWQHPERGLLAPGEFLHLLEGTQLEILVGEWVIESALKQISAWRMNGLLLTVSVNISPSHLQRENFVERLQGILARYPEVSPDNLELEIVESSAIDDLARAAKTLSACLDLGVRFALDDFGTGYSSLTHFRKLPVKTLKIDQTFVRDMLDDAEAFGIVENVVHLAKVFDRSVIAEGVETPEHSTLLILLGCHLAQGYGISRPLPPNRMIEWVAHWKRNTDHQDPLAVGSNLADSSHYNAPKALSNDFRDEPEPQPTIHSLQQRLKRWCSVNKATTYRQWHEYMALEESYENFHAFASEVLALTAAGQHPSSEVCFSDLLSSRDMLVARLDQFVQRVKTVK